MHIRAVVAMGLHTAAFASGMRFPGSTGSRLGLVLRPPHCPVKVGGAQCTPIRFRQRQGATSRGEVAGTVGHWAALGGGEGH